MSSSWSDHEYQMAGIVSAGEFPNPKTIEENVFSTLETKSSQARLGLAPNREWLIGAWKKCRANELPRIARSVDRSRLEFFGMI